MAAHVVVVICMPSSRACMYTEVSCTGVLNRPKVRAEAAHVRVGQEVVRVEGLPGRGVVYGK